MASGVYKGFEFDHVRGPYKNAKPGATPQWHIRIGMHGQQGYRTISRQYKEEAEAIVASLRGELKAAEDKKDSEEGDDLDFERELRLLALQLQRACTKEEVDIVKKKADAFKALRQLQLTAPPKETTDETEGMSVQQLLEVAAEHLRGHGYTVTYESDEGREASDAPDSTDR